MEVYAWNSGWMVLQYDDSDPWVKGPGEGSQIKSLVRCGQPRNIALLSIFSVTCMGSLSNFHSSDKRTKQDSTTNCGSVDLVSIHIGGRAGYKPNTLLNLRCSLHLAAFYTRTANPAEKQDVLAKALETLQVDACRVLKSIITIRSLDATSLSQFAHSVRWFDFWHSWSGWTALSARTEGALLYWTLVNGRLCAARLNGSGSVNGSRLRHRCLFIAYAYAPLRATLVKKRHV